MIDIKLKIKTAQKVLVDLEFSFTSSLAIVGESGSGKSLTLKALLDMLPENLEKNLKAKSEFELNKKNISFVPQNPFTALSPLTKISKHFMVDKKTQEKLLKLVSLDKSILNRFPPELSGGQLQRVVIALSLEKNPKLILFDEPTTALDPNTKDEILKLIKQMQQEIGFKTIFVTHDIYASKEVCSEILVIKDGKLQEFGKMSDIINNPKNIYTKKLIEANFKSREFRK